MALEDVKVGQVLKQHIETHPEVGALGKMTAVALNASLEKIGAGLERKLNAAVTEKNLKLDAVQRKAAVDDLGASMADTLVTAVIAPQLRQIPDVAAVAATLADVNTALKTLTEEEFASIANEKVATALANAGKVKKDELKPKIKEDTKRDTFASQVTASRSWGGKK